MSMKHSLEKLNSRTAKVGGYSFVLSLFVLAILIAVNVAVNNLPSTWTHYDISAAQLYSVTSATKAVAQKTTEDVTIYWITQDGEEDTVIEKLLDVYDALSDHISVSKINPDIYPTFAAQYTSDTVYNNSLIVECGEKSRFISYYDIYLTEYTSSYYSYSVSYSFDGEGAITTAIDYVTREDLPVLYFTTGHGEPDISDSFAESLEKQNIETASFSLLTVDEIPEDADAVFIYAPTSDFAEEEITMLEEYLEAGGKLFVISGPQEEESMDNLHSLLEAYGITMEEGIVVEGDRSYYAFGYPYVLLPELGDSDITSELAANNSYIIVPIAGGMSIGSSDATVTSLLDTSDSAFSKIAGYSLTTYEMEDGDISGPFSVALTVETTEGGRMVWISADYVMEETYISYSSGANSDFVMNAISWLIGESDAISIRSKSLDYSYLTISTTEATWIELWIIGIIPLFYLLLGVIDAWDRRKKA